MRRYFINWTDAKMEETANGAWVSVNAAEAEIARLDGALVAAGYRVEAAEAERETLRQQVEALGFAADNLRFRIDELDNALDSAEAKADRYKAALELIAAMKPPMSKGWEAQSVAKAALQEEKP